MRLYACTYVCACVYMCMCAYVYVYMNARIFKNNS